MGVPMGVKKHGGRVKGTPNKATEELQAKAKELGCDPFTILCLFAMGDWKRLGYPDEKYIAQDSEKSTTYKFHVDPAVRAKCAQEAVQYLYPKRKAVELSSSDESGLMVVIKDYTRESK